MGLKEYKRKRDFQETPEPSAKAKPRPLEIHPGKPLRFVIHKHDATHIHYDLRLELGGVLKSWAIPKGLATPRDRRKLAVSVEDHPFEYLDFEGRIPEGQYGAGKIAIWDTGHWIPLEDPEAGIEKGKLAFRLEGGKVRGRFTLARMKNGDWLIILARLSDLNQDLLAEGTPSTMPPAVTPMLGVLSEKVFDSPDYIYEVKFDGMRAVSFLRGDGSLSVMSRNRKEQDFRYPELVDLAGHFLAEELVVDGEIVALDEQGISRFQLLQGRFNLTGAADIENAARATPAYYYIFDLLYLNGRDLTALPLERRKAILERIFMPRQYIRLSEWVAQRGEAMFAFARQHGLEGVVAKRRQSTYRQKRSRDWLKFKAVRQQEFVIGGFTEPRASRAYFGALLLGLYEGGDLVYTGHVGTGFSDEALGRLHGLMKPLRQRNPPFKGQPRPNEPAHWLKPELVAEVRFAEWTREGLLRQPVFLGLRFDISPRECVMEEKPGAAAPSVAGSERAAEAAPSGPVSSQPAAPEPAPPAEGPTGGPFLFPAMPEPLADDMRLAVAGRQILLTNLKKILWPDEGYTKFDLINHYNRVSQFILPHLAGRPLTLKRYPDGIEAGPFFQKEAPPETPGWVRTEVIASESGRRRERIRYLICEDLPVLLFLANLACISHNPWLSTLPDLERPDIIAFDLDPVDPDDFEACVEAALLIKDKLGTFGLRGYPKTSGATGMHIYVPVHPKYTFGQARQFAEIIALLCHGERPDLITLEQPVARRAGARLYLDFLQNVKGKTLASVYSVRARAGAPVSTPLDWSEIRAGLRPTSFNIVNITDRLREKGDLFAGALSDRQDLLGALEQGGKLLKAG